MHKSSNISKWLKNLPNKLTLARLAVIPFLLTLYPLDFAITNIFCALLFGVGALTDFFDGYLARRYNIESSFGALIDPIADKLLITAAVVLLASMGQLSALLATLLLTREVAITGLRMAAMELNTKIEVSNLGKLKTVIQDVAIFFLMLNIDSIQTIGTFLIIMGIIIAWYSAWEYWKVFWQKNKEHFNGQ